MGCFEDRLFDKIRLANSVIQGVNKDDSIEKTRLIRLVLIFSGYEHNHPKIEKK
jgi:hypothetical protein